MKCWITISQKPLNMLRDIKGEQTLEFLKSVRDTQGIRESITKSLRKVLKEIKY